MGYGARFFWQVLIVKVNIEPNLTFMGLRRTLAFSAVTGLLLVALSAPAEAGRRKRSEVPPPVVIDRTVFTPIVSGL